MLLYIAVALGGFPAMTAAFGTINAPAVLGQHNEHEMITRLAFQCPNDQKSDGICFEPRSLDQLAGYHVNVMGIALTGSGTNGAVGAPDTFDPFPEGPEAHCDDADYLDIPEYPQSRTEANAKLQACVDHLRHRFRQAVGAADRLLDERHRVRRDMVQLSLPYGDCTFAFPGLQHDDYGRAKCSTLEGFGRALHGVQDFYAHSNWADSADPNQPISISNPPGLGMTGTASFLDLRANGTIPPDQIPLNLTTGCFNLPDVTFGSGGCKGRITHHALSKDRGIIHLDGTFGAAEADPRSEAVSSNFQLAVKAAVQHSRELWDGFRDEIRHKYGNVSGDLMICSLIRDDPVKDCRNRTVVMAVDNSLASESNGGILLEEALADEVTSRLNTEGLDSVAVVGSQEPAVLRYPMGPPAHASFSFAKPSGELCFASGLELAIAQTIEAQPETYTDRGTIILFATSADSLDCCDGTVTQLRRAEEEGIRVHYACIDMHGNEAAGGSNEVAWTRCLPSDPLVPPVLKTGGLAVFIGPAARVPAHFADLVIDRGLTATDEDENTPEHTRVYPGITLADFLKPDQPTKSFTYPVSIGERVNFTLSSVSLKGRSAEACFGVTLWYKYPNTEISTHTRCGDSAPLLLRYEATESFDLVLEAEYGDTAPKEEFLHREEVLFLLSVDTNMLDKSETTVKKTKSILSSTDHGSLTSETVDVESGTATVDNATTTWTQRHKATDDGSLSCCRPVFGRYPMCGATIPVIDMVGNLTEGQDGDELQCDAASEYRFIEQGH
ncbi:hypothetical protein C7999DRAFT_14623 [Corynascus novoguineensis]|uniref:VWFA domain-containing protein n=1 Tax=Corynascus novoguineensis TaxID=1126955 RepID=A0AAN7HNQ0_9PEZI|nr:hypothetical protein C7999DRAFT_14623 [Corynascus novoguineensis]